MATRTLKASGTGNWSALSTWVENIVPVAGDDVVVTAGSTFALTVSGAAACATLNFTGGGALSLTMNATLTVTGGVTLIAGMTLAGTNTLILNGTQTITSNGKTWSPALQFTGAFTFTLGDDWTVSGLLTLGTSSTASVINSNTLIATGNFTCGAAGAPTVSGTTLIKLTGTGTWTGPATGTLANNLTIDAGAGTITLSNNIHQYLTGTLTYVSGTIANAGSSSQLVLTGNCSLDTSGMTWQALAFLNGPTVTLLSALHVSAAMSLPNSNVTFSGAFDIDVGTLTTNITNTANRTLTLVAGQTLTINTAFTIAVAATLTRWLIVSSTGGTKANLTLVNGATQDVGFVNPTDIDSSRGQQIFSYKGVITTCINWYSTFPVVRRDPQEMMVG